MKIFLKHMNLALWCSLASSVISFFCYLFYFLVGCNDSIEKVSICTFLWMLGITICSVWGLIIWAMHDKEKRDKEHEKIMKKRKQEHKRFMKELGKYRICE